MIWVCIAEGVVILGLAGACVAIALGAMAKIADLEAAAQRERFQLHERIRAPEQRPVAVGHTRRRGGDDDRDKPKDLGALAQVGTVVPMRDHEQGTTA